MGETMPLLKRSRLTFRKILLIIILAFVLVLSANLVARLYLELDVEKPEPLPVEERWQILDASYDGESTHFKIKYLGENAAKRVGIYSTSRYTDSLNIHREHGFYAFYKGQTKTFTVPHYTFSVSLSYSSKNLEEHYHVDLDVLPFSEFRE
jgi:hypothetical protein